MSSEEMRRRRKLYLMSRTKSGSTFALDELGEVKDPISAICKWANENLDDREIRRLQAALGRLVDQTEDNGHGALSPVTGDDDYSDEGPVFAESKRKLNAGARQAHDEALAPGVSYDRLFSDTKRLGPEQPTSAGTVQAWIK